MAHKKLLKVGIVGATGLVGGELVQMLSRENFPVEELSLFAGIDDAGERVEFMGDPVTVEPICAGFHQGLDLVFFAAHPMVSRDLAEDAANSGALVIDASRSFRLRKDVPLVVPEVNPEALGGLKRGGGIVASPGPAVVALSLALFPLVQELGVKRAVAFVLYGSTVEGRAGFEEHQSQTIAIFNDQEFEVDKFPHQTAFNIFPQVGRFVSELTEEESDIEQELKKVLSLPKLRCNVTCAQAPVFAGVSIAACVQTRDKAEVAEVRTMLGSQAGVLVLDNPEQGEYPDVLASLEHDQVMVGRIRKEPGGESGFQFWINSDNLRKGSSLNMVQIAELALTRGLL
jgi:aspartate-semialdehyde dehydrogenase